MFFLMVVLQMKTGYFQRHNISLQKNSLLQLFIRWFGAPLRKLYFLNSMHAWLPVQQIRLYAVNMIGSSFAHARYCQVLPYSAQWVINIAGW